MTITQAAGKTGLSERIVRSDIEALGIKPIGTLKTRPLQYPEDTADKIRAARGLNTTNGHAGTPEDGKIISHAKLKKVRDSHAKKKAA